MADVLYVHPAKHAIGHGYAGLGTPYVFMPVGIVGLANLLRAAGFAVRGVNYPAELARDEHFDLNAWIADNQDARVVLIDLHWYEHAYGAMEVARVCKETLPHAWTVIGGMTASIFADEIIATHPYVDYIIRGDAEVPLVRLVQALCDGDAEAVAAVPNVTYRRGEVIRENPHSYVAGEETLEGLDFVDLSFLDHADWYRRMQFSATSLTVNDKDAKGHWLCIGRGCRFNCSFCGGGARSHKAIFHRNGVLTRSPDRVAADVARLAELGVRQVSLNLDPTMVGDRYATDLLLSIRASGAKLGLYNEQFSLPKPRFLADLAETFAVDYSELAFTMLSGCEAVRRRNGKSFSNRAFLRLLACLRDIGLPIYVYFSLNLPGEDESTFEQTLDLARAIADSYPPRLLKMINIIHTLDPLSPMAEQPRRYAITTEFKSFRDYYAYCRVTPAARPGVLSVALRGFKDSRKRSLVRMAERWNTFCQQRGGMCYPVPPTW